MHNGIIIIVKLKLIPKVLIIIICWSLVYSTCNLSLLAKQKPSDIKENNYLSIIQDLSFGAFCAGSSGGTVIIPSVGSRRSTGSIILIPNQSGFPAILQFTTDKTNIVTITTGNIVNLTNSSGGSITLQINDFYPASTFSPIIGQNNVTIGGILTVGSQSSTPAGNYSGSFEVTFNEQ